MAIDTTLAQLAPGPASLESLYTVPTGKRASLYVVVTNRSAASVTYRISFAENGALDDPKQYVAYDATVGSIPKATRRVALNAGDIVRVYAGTSDLTFCVNGIEQDT